MALPAEEKKLQACPLCGARRLPRYKTDKSWAKHQEFCRAPPGGRGAAAAGEGAAGAAVAVRAAGEAELKRPRLSPGREASSAPQPSASGESAAGVAGAAGEGEAELKRPRLSPGREASSAPTPIASLDDIPRLVHGLDDLLRELEFSTVQLGVTLGEGGLSDDVAARLAQGSDRASLASHQEAAKLSVLRGVRQEFERRHPRTEVVSQNPDLNLLLDVSAWRFLPPVPSAVYLYGRYRKLARGLPQTRWPCVSCRGERSGRYGKRAKGEHPDGGAGATGEGGGGGAASGPSTCKACRGSGLQYPDSVQDLVGRGLVEAFGAEDCVFHGMGREDVDVRCLGRGRPFVLELRAPKRRSPLVDLGALSGVVAAEGRGLVELAGPLRPSTRAEPARLKAAAADKTYVIRFRVEGGFRGAPDEEAILALAGRALDQRTPSRVEHRRADLVRDRKIVALGPLVSEGDEVELTIRAQSGTYIKEFVHGDEGRTVPSVAAVLGRPCHVVWLDVTEIHVED